MSWLDSATCAACAYALVIALAVALGYTEVAARRTGTADTLWPTFWFATAVLLLAMAVGRLTDTAEFLADIGRRQARSDGWYETRRRWQAVVVGSIAVGWCCIVAVAIWRVPERRRMYLPTAVVVFTLVCFAAVRVISLHQMDAVLYNREYADITPRSIIELSLLATTAATMLVRFVHEVRPQGSAS